MKKPQDISSYEELQQRKKELDLEVEVSRRELAHSLGTSRVNLNEFLLKKIALPIGGAVAAAWLVPKLFRSRKPDVIHKYHEKPTVADSDSDGDPARYHYPVPPPETDDDDADARYVVQRPRYQRPVRPDVTSTQQIAAAEKAKVRAKSAEDRRDRKQKKRIINAATIASVAKIAVPAIKLIVEKVSDYKEKQATPKEGYVTSKPVKLPPA